MEKIKEIRGREIEKYIFKLALIYKDAFSLDEKTSYEILKERQAYAISNDLNPLLLIYLEDEKILGAIFGFSFSFDTWFGSRVRSFLDESFLDMTFELKDIFVERDRRNKKIGTKLMKYLEKMGYKKSSLQQKIEKIILP